MTGTSYTWEVMEPICRRIHNGEFKTKIAQETGIHTQTQRDWYEKWCKREKVTPRPPEIPRGYSHKPPPIVQEPEITPNSPAKILIYDIETLPNLGFFWDTYSDRGVPLEFILKPKAICTIAWKWYGESETYVAVIDTPYDDKPPLQTFLPEWEKADYVVAHYSRFDKPFIAARLMANGLPSLPPVNDICTYKLAKNHFGRSLNGNKLDHLGEILGLGRKNKTTANLWVGCAQGDKAALEEMALYNKQDVDLLAKVFEAMLPHVKSKININLITDDPVLKCKQCGSTNIQLKGYEYTPSSMRHRYLCECGSWSTFPRKAGKL